MDPIPSTLSEAAILVLNTPDADQKVMVLIYHYLICIAYLHIRNSETLARKDPY